MSGVISGVRGLIGRGGDVGAKVDGLQRAAAAARGRLDDAVVDVAEQVVARASQRLRLSADDTVVASTSSAVDRRWTSCTVRVVRTPGWS